VNDTSNAAIPITVKIVLPYFMLDCPLATFRKNTHTKKDSIRRGTWPVRPEDECE
jgi:hypothetical protein